MSTLEVIVSCKRDNDPFKQLLDMLPYEEFLVPDFEPARKMRKPKRNVDDLKEPAETVAVNTEYLKAVVDRETFHPHSAKGEMMAEHETGPEEFRGEFLGREGVINVLAATGLTADLRYNARTYGHIEEVDARLPARRRWRFCYGAIDRASKYDVDNRWGEVDTTCKKFKNLGRGVFYGVRDGSHHSDEYIDIVRCYDTNTVNEDGYYNRGSVHDWAQHELEEGWVIYIDVSMGKLDGRGGGLVPNPQLDATICDMVRAGFIVHAAIHLNAVFDQGIKICDWWKNLAHNEEFIAVFCQHESCDDHIDYDVGPSNLERDRKIYERDLESGTHGKFTANFRQRRNRNTPVKKTKPRSYTSRLKMARGVRKVKWEKMVMCPTLPPPPTVPILTDLNWRIAINKVPDGALLATFCSFVWDPRFASRYSDTLGWVRAKDKNVLPGDEIKYQVPMLEDYVRWSGADLGGYDTDED